MRVYLIAYSVYKKTTKGNTKFDGVKTIVVENANSQSHAASTAYEYMPEDGDILSITDLDFDTTIYADVPRIDAQTGKEI